MNQRHLLLATALTAACAAAAAQSGAPRPDDAKDELEKCYGARKPGASQCGTAAHGCSSKAKPDSGAPQPWKLVPKGTCEKLGGKTTPPQQQLAEQASSRKR